jgi:hypothetical protein
MTSRVARELCEAIRANPIIGVSTSFRWPQHLVVASGRFVVPVGYERAVRSGLDGDGLLHEPVEELAAAA